jgi:DNA-binding transcriptional LysR family regulator
VPHNGTVSLLQLESFVVLAEERSVTRAAERLRVSQPPLTRRLRALEEELGVQLFERHGRGVRLLPPGQVLLARARQILADVDAVAQAVVAAAAHAPAGHPRT